MIKTYRFNRQIDADFYRTLKSRVNAYFTNNNISRKANAEMVIKTIVLMAIYFIPLAIVYSGLVTSVLPFLGLWMLMGVGAAGIGFSVMHDANHGAYSQNETINKILGNVVNMLGVNSSIWKYQHNVLHHSYTNIHGADEDIDIPFFLRFSPHQKQRKFHRYQHIYAWFLYGFMILTKVFITDFTQIFHYRKIRLVKSPRDLWGLILKVSGWKLIYFFTTIVLPILILPVSPWLVISGVLLMHYVLGLTMAIVFQTAHVMPDVHFPLPNESGTVENNWAVHQMLTTTNFAPKNRLLSWYLGGLNFQVENHLFPTICHVHYRNLSKIVSETAAEFEIPYNSIHRFREAISEHARMLYMMGNAPSPAV
jgi:linoleoyl-CoA desaturase